MRPDDIVQPTDLCLQIIHQFKAHHRGTVVVRPDRHKCVIVQWCHKKKPVLMAGRYVELASIQRGHSESESDGVIYQIEL